MFEVFVAHGRASVARRHVAVRKPMMTTRGAIANQPALRRFCFVTTHTPSAAAQHVAQLSGAAMPCRECSWHAVHHLAPDVAPQDQGRQCLMRAESIAATHKFAILCLQWRRGHIVNRERATLSRNQRHTARCGRRAVRCRTARRRIKGGSAFCRRSASPQHLFAIPRQRQGHFVNSG